MITDFLSVLGIGTKRETKSSTEQNASIKADSSTEESTEIVLQRFIEIELDVAGWFALGHHRPKEFINAVAKHENRRHLAEKRVERAWAKIEGNNIEYFKQPVAGAYPVTLTMLCD